MRVLIDACVLYPTVMREVVLGVAAKGLFDPRWSPRILEEWARAARKIGPQGETIARGEIAAITARFPRAQVQIPQGVEARLWLPDPNDIHVLAAAVGCSADAIMTVNAKDFPRNELADEGLQRVDPDGFLVDLAMQHPDAVQSVGEAVLTEARRLSGEPWEMRKLMRKARLPRLGKLLA
ncbi:MAG: PIN domain-containing protein [Octadecabacter sp.]|nr:PIN domain-containing protein [Octadecabacter sp.]